MIEERSSLFCSRRGANSPIERLFSLRSPPIGRDAKLHPSAPIGWKDVQLPERAVRHFKRHRLLADRGGHRLAIRLHDGGDIERKKRRQLVVLSGNVRHATHKRRGKRPSRVSTPLQVHSEGVVAFNLMPRERLLRSKRHRVGKIDKYERLRGRLSTRETRVKPILQCLHHVWQRSEWVLAESATISEGGVFPPLVRREWHAAFTPDSSWRVGMLPGVPNFGIIP
mmetsp:Transcript_49830/g.123877  ORF Transcript_49830/g.123877 Transcript_49830/m.123877 type:complete len:225 (-) Transcript_49830:535-1209(-)